MDCVTATNEFIGILRVGSVALQSLLENDTAVTCGLETEFNQIFSLLDNLGEIAQRLQERAANSSARFA